MIGWCFLTPTFIIFNIKILFFKKINDIFAQKINKFVLKMEFPESYLKWIQYLKEEKLYASWIKDVSAWLFLTNSISSYNKYLKPFIFMVKDISRLTRGFEINNEEYIKWTISNLVTYKWLYQASGIKWSQIYKEFKNKKNLKVNLSPKLSRRLYRRNNKVSNGKPKGTEYQPWYDKSYEKYKFGNKVWRK